MITAISAIIFFSMLIFVHELGHFIAARSFDIKVYEFALGMGPAIWKKQRGETLYAIRAIPMGGYCKMDEDVTSDDSRAFGNKPWWARIIVLFSGAFMNVLLGFLLCLILVSSQGKIVTTIVDSTIPESNAARILQHGDKIVNVNGSSVKIMRELQFATQSLSSQPIDVTIIRNGKKTTQSILPHFDKESNRYIIGFIRQVVPINPINLIREAFYETIWLGKMIFIQLGWIFSGKVSMKEISGPVGIVSEIGNAARLGILNLIYLASFMTVNLGIFNLLPIPALDGGRIVFILVEAIWRKPLKTEHEAVVHFIGFILLIGLMLFATWNDLARLGGQWLQSLFGTT